MTVRAGLLLRAALGAALAVLLGAGAGAATPGQDEMNVVDQPGYQPTPEEEQLGGAYEKQEVFFRTTEAPGTIIIDTKGRFLYLVRGATARFAMASASAARLFGPGCKDSAQAGMAGLASAAGNDPAPALSPRFMAGGPGNPLGARAMYLGATVYRIHGTNQPQTIGHAVSSGCFVWSTTT
jgi:lipoprotein-anchoring transpeptidase ErfK/SrfK